MALKGPRTGSYTNAVNSRYNFNRLPVADFVLAQTSVLPDEYFKNTTLLLSTSSTNGAQNNTFLDSSNNNFTITRNGNATQGTYSPYSHTGWSNYFDGSSTLRYTGSPISTSQSNFTIEAWVYPTQTPTFGGGVAQVVVDANGEAGGSFWGFGLNTSLNVVWRWYDGGSGFNTTSVGTIPLNQWSHIAVSVNSNNITLYINGTQQSVTGTSTLTNRGGNTGYVNIGRYATTDAFYGYISNARLIAGTGLYTSSFTPSTNSLAAISNTSILTCQNNRFIDNSTNNSVITIYGTPSAQPFGPFSPTEEYSTTTVGGSAYFDGTGDSLSVAGLTSFTPGVGDWTVEGWIYPISGNWALVSGSNFYVSNNGGTVYVGDGSVDIIAVAPPPTTVWTHIAATKYGSTVRLFYNGVQVGSSTTALSSANTSSMLVGGRSSVPISTNGYLSNVRIVIGTAVYTSNFTPPSLPVTTAGSSTPYTNTSNVNTTFAAANTSLLCNFTNAGIFDATARNILETVGNAQASQTQTKFGASSMYFDGTGDTLKIPYSQNFVFGSGNWTIELWVYLNSTGRQGFAAFGDGSGTTVPWEIGVGSAGKFRLLVQNSGGQIIMDGSTNPTTGTWYHIAGVRNGSTATLYVNGTAEASSSSLGTGSLSTLTNIISVGTYSYGFELNGYIDDLRITKGVARYTANFTPPSRTFALR